MKHKKLLFFVATAIMSFGILTPLMLRANKEVLEPDNAVYDEDPDVVDFNNPEEIVNPDRRAATLPSGIIIHYHNDDEKCIPNTKGPGREFWIWAAGINGSAYQVDAGGSDTDITLTLAFTGENANFAKKTSLSFIAKMKGDNNWEGKSDNTLVTYEEFNLNASNYIEVWAIPGEGSSLELYKTYDETQMDRYLSANFTDFKHIEVVATDRPMNYKLYALTGSYMKLSPLQKKAQIGNYLIAQGANPVCQEIDINPDPHPEDPEYQPTIGYKFTVTLNHTIRINAQYQLNGVFPEWQTYTKSKYVSAHKLYDQQRFKTYYHYDGNDLGATYNGTSTTFKVWAPTAARVRLTLFRSGTSTNYDDVEPGIVGDDIARFYNMSFKKGGVWVITITNQDLLKSYSYYNFVVYNSLGQHTVMDPYAKSAGINGERGLVVDWSKTNPEGWDKVPQIWNTDKITSATKVGSDSSYNIKIPNELTIYETHIRDLTMDSTWVSNEGNERGTFKAFIEPGTTYSANNKTVSTGFDHIKDFGPSAIQIVPVFDHDNAEERPNRHYNWGYNPLNFNCVEGSYSSDPYDGYARIREFKELITAFANADGDEHTRIIMDVVYNHVNSASDSCFNLLMPRYYFRTTENGEFYNGSGCGNEVKSEAYMMRKYIIDSLKFWAKEYKIKGFRFDLMGLIDVGTIDDARQALYDIDPDIYIYGEGWTGDGSGFDYGTKEAYQVHGNQDLHDDDTPNHNYLTQDQIRLLGCVRTSVYRYLYPKTGTCYVGMFNDNGRNELKGGNDMRNGDGSINGNFWGFITQGTDDVGNKSEAVRDLLAGYHTGYGGNPVQCVNYASCHDNFALFDQLTYEVSQDNTPDIARICEATVSAEAAILMSNGAAFVRGGEEIFQTKDIVPGSEDDELAIRSKYEMMGTRKISHDSYNLSDEVNAFHWDRKIEIDGVSTTGYYEEYKHAVEVRKQLPKYTREQLLANDPFSSSSPFNIWGYGYGSNNVAVCNTNANGYNTFFFITGYVYNTTSFNFTPYFNQNVNHIDMSSGRHGGTGNGFSTDSYGKNLQFHRYSSAIIH